MMTMLAERRERPLTPEVGSIYEVEYKSMSRKVQVTGRSRGAWLCQDLNFPLDYTVATRMFVRKLP